MEIATPPGYSRLVALDSKQHRGLGVVRCQHGFAASLTGVSLAIAEFVQAARHYPIVFAEDAAGDGFVPIAVTGLEQNINLFVNAAGEWAPNTYIPAYVRCWPFYGVHLTGPRAQSDELLICVDPAGLEAETAPLFDAQGKPRTPLTAAQTLIRELENARAATLQLCRDLKELGLLAPFEAHALPKQGREWRVRGMYRVDEARLNALAGEKVKMLMQSGTLSRIYAHLMSLDNFKFLMDRALARKSGAAAAV